MAWDSRPEARLAAADKARIADPMTTSIHGYSGIVVSPGVPLEPPPDRARGARRRRCR